MSVSVRRWLAEALGTYVLVVIGSMAILSALAAGANGAFVVAVALGFGLALLAGLYAFGEVSGGHYNPAVSLAMLLDGRLSTTDFVGYVIAQVGGAVLASVTVLAVAGDAVDDTVTALRPGIEAWEGILIEVVATAIFVAVILKVTKSVGSAATAFLGISLTLVAVHLATIPFTGTSVNPARSIGPALVGGVGADLWLYIVAPLIGGIVAWVLYRAVTTEAETTTSRSF